jgi:uncharacterized RDD family membrane protein YckC
MNGRRGRRLAGYRGFFYYSIFRLRELMQCPVCAVVVIPNARYCQGCGAKFAVERVLFGAKPREFSLTPEEDDWELDLDKDGIPEHPPSPLEQPNNRKEGEPDQENATTDNVQWGGFLRRGLAFAIDGVIICVISSILFVLCFIGYKVGLAAHDRTLSSENSQGLIIFLTWGWMFLVTSYFVIFHGLEGQTVGKWLLGLRVIGEHGARLSYKRASLRWLGELMLAPLVLGILWIIWSPEKRAWHDYLARTWVIKE